MKSIRSFVCIWLICVLSACSSLSEKRQPEIIVPAEVQKVSITVPKSQEIDQFKNNRLTGLQYPGLHNYPPRSGVPAYKRWGYKVYPLKNGKLQVLKIEGAITDGTRALKAGHIKYTVDQSITDKGDLWLIQYEPIKKEYYTPFDLMQNEYVVNSFEINELNRALSSTFFTYSYEVNSSLEPNLLIKSLLRSGVDVKNVQKDENMDRASAIGTISLKGEVTSLQREAKVDLSVNVFPTKLGSRSVYKLKVPFLFNEQYHFDLAKTISDINKELDSIAQN